jgi:hypothetical protein
MPNSFDTNVFVNCPFDDDYRNILLGIVFTIIYLNFVPRLALESNDSSESRIDKIIDLIQNSKFGIHDLSRIISSRKGEHYRMNMPFELGVDFGCKKFKHGKWQSKKILILEEQRYRYQKSLSDLSGSDIKNHNNDVDKAIIEVRNWFVAETSMRAKSGSAIWDEYNDFQAYLYDEVVEKDGHRSVDEVQIVEVIHHMKVWLERNPI